MTRTQEAEISWFHRSGRESGVSWWGERPTWARHVTYWVVALGLLSLSLFDTDAGPATASNDDLSSFVWIVMGILSIAVAALIFTLREWNAVGLLRTISRSLVLFTFILGFAASWLFYARGFGVEIIGCDALEGQEICRVQASPQQVLGMLAWQAAGAADHGLVRLGSAGAIGEFGGGGRDRRHSTVAGNRGARPSSSGSGMDGGQPLRHRTQRLQAELC